MKDSVRLWQGTWGIISNSRTVGWWVHGPIRRHDISVVSLICDTRDTFLQHYWRMHKGFKQGSGVVDNRCSVVVDMQVWMRLGRAGVIFYLILKLFICAPRN